MKIRELVSKIAKLEGKKHQASVSDVREILKLVFIELANMPLAEAGELLSRYKRKGGE